MLSGHVQYILINSRLFSLTILYSLSSGRDGHRLASDYNAQPVLAPDSRRISYQCTRVVIDTVLLKMANFVQQPHLRKEVATLAIRFAVLRRPVISGYVSLELLRYVIGILAFAWHAFRPLSRDG